MSEPRPPGRVPQSTDPDVDLRDATQRREYGPRHPAILGVIAAGGVLGALLRYQIGRWWPTPVDHFPAATLTINLAGCLAIGILLAVIGEMRSPHPLVRPLVGTGILGGFTTFSTYAVDIQTLLRRGQDGTALAYLAITALGAVAAVWLGLFLTRYLFRRIAPRTQHRRAGLMLGYLLVAVGAALGAPLRYLTDRAVQARHDSLFPWGTFTVNVVGSLILGVLTGVTLAGGSGSDLRLLIGTGFCGALTTYSTFSFETVRLLEQHARFLAIANLLGTLVAGLGSAVLGYAIGQAW